MTSYGRRGGSRPVSRRDGAEFSPDSRPSRCLDALRALGGEADTGQIRAEANRAGGTELSVPQTRIALDGLLARRPPPVQLTSRGRGRYGMWRLVPVEGGT